MLGDRAAEAVDRYLDALLLNRGEAFPEPEPSLAATVRDLHALSIVSPPAGARDRVWRRVMGNQDRVAATAAPSSGSRHAAIVQIASPLPVPTGSRLARLSPLLELAAVAALLLALLGGLGYERGLLPLIAAPQTATAAPAPADVPAMVGGNAARTGAQPGPGPSGTPGILWRFGTGGPIYSAPVVAAGTAFVASVDGNLYAVDTASGRERWRFPILSGISAGSGVAVAAGTVYTCGTDGSLYALDAATGKGRWRVRLPAPNCPAPPVVANGLVLFASDVPGIGYLYANDAVTGARRWRFDAPGAAVTGWAEAGGSVFVTADNNVYALDAASGRQRWHFQTGVRLGWPMVSGESVYVQGSTNIVIAIDTATGHDR